MIGVVKGSTNTRHVDPLADLWEATKRNAWKAREEREEAERQKAAAAKAAAECASTADPLRAMMQNVSVRIATKINATNATHAAQAQAQLEEEHKHLLDEAATLVAAQRRLESV